MLSQSGTFDYFAFITGNAVPASHIKRLVPTLNAVYSVNINLSDCIMKYAGVTIRKGVLIEEEQGLFSVGFTPDFTYIATHGNQRLLFEFSHASLLAPSIVPAEVKISTTFADKETSSKVEYLNRILYTPQEDGQIFYTLNHRFPVPGVPYSTFCAARRSACQKYPAYCLYKTSNAGARDPLQFGVTLPEGVAAVFGTSRNDKNCVKPWGPNDMLLDIGAGTGSLVAQVATTIGIPSIGIECVPELVQIGNYVNREFYSSTDPNYWLVCQDATAPSAMPYYMAANIYYMTNDNFDTVHSGSNRRTAALNVDGIKFYTLEQAILYRLATALLGKKENVQAKEHYIITTCALGASRRNKNESVFQLSFMVENVRATLVREVPGIDVAWNTKSNPGFVYRLSVD